MVNFGIKNTMQLTRTRFSLSNEEQGSIDALGGIERVVEIADGILKEHGINRSLFSAHERQDLRLRSRVIFEFDSGKSLRANIDDLLQQAQEVQANAGGTNYVGAMLQHLVGAKLDLVMGAGKLKHHGASVADHSTERKGDFQVEEVAIHVTTHPSEALVRKCAANLKAGLKPLIISIGDGVSGAAFLLKNSDLADRVDVLDAGQFLTANVYERSFFKAAECKVTLSKLLARYNEIVASCETDPTLLVRMPGLS
ncbi:MAG: DUF4928 family protein [Chthoniobacterales bacterium]